MGELLVLGYVFTELVICVMNHRSVFLKTVLNTLLSSPACLEAPCDEGLVFTWSRSEAFVFCLSFAIPEMRQINSTCWVLNGYALQ